MSQQFRRALFLIWLFCYLAGPLFETFDFWDMPQEEMSDIASSACGALIWAAAGLCITVFAFRQFCKCFSRLAVLRTNALSPLSFKIHLCLMVDEPIPALDTSPLRV